MAERIILQGPYGLHDVLAEVVGAIVLHNEVNVLLRGAEFLMLVPSVLADELVVKHPPKPYLQLSSHAGGELEVLW